MDKWLKRIAIGLLVIVALVLLVFIVINYNEPWTGFGEQPKSDTKIPAKTLWDWLDLFIVSLVVALAIFWLNTSQKQREKKLQKDTQHQDTLLDYYDKISKLILEHKLDEVAANHEPDKNESVMVVARALTLATFRNLDSTRTPAVLRFLNDAKLSDKLIKATDMEGVNFANSYLIGADLKNANLSLANLEGARLDVANLEGARLRGARLKKANLTAAGLRGADLGYTDLSGANLNHADLSRVNLGGAILRRANLREADLSGADLGYTDLSGTNLRGADLSGADLGGAILRRSILRGTNLRGAILGRANLTMAFATQNRAHLKGTRYSNLTKWPNNFDPIAAGAINVDGEE